MDLNFPHGVGPLGTELSAEQMQRMQRMENIGLLATRVAHDLNNMLTPMLLAAPMLRESIRDPAALSLLETMEASVVRATALVRQILDYAQGEGGQARLVPLQQLLHEIARFMEETFPRHIAVEKRIPDDLWMVSANLSQIHQVLLNLCVNARDAMARGGTLRLRALNCQLDAIDATAINGGRAGAFLLLEVADTGIGFPAEVLAHMWEPFITTKTESKGTGLGLSTVRSIIVDHGGFIQFNTRPGYGSCFKVYLPAVGTPSVRTGDGTWAPVIPLVETAN